MLTWIIILTLGLVILNRVRKIVVIQRCPDYLAIRDYFEGRLKRQDKQEYERIISHLGICEKCQKLLTDMAVDDSESAGRAIEEHLIQPAKDPPKDGGHA